MGSRLQIFLGVIALAFIALAALTRTGVIENPSAVTAETVSSNSSLPEDLDYGSVEELYDQLKEEYEGELSEDALLEGLKKGLVDATGDQYTTYFTEEEAEVFNSSLNGTFTGIGAELGLNDNRQLIIVSPLKGFPAEAAGVRTGDIILNVDGESTDGWSVEQAVGVIRGEKGSEVTLTVGRSEEGVIDITITRDEIVVPSVEWELLEGNVGYIELSRFSDDTTKLTTEAADELLDQGATSIVLDLRNNGGGLLSAAVNVSGIWVDDKLVVEQRRGGESFDRLDAPSGSLLGNVPTVVLVNEGSASASEIVAGALQDYDLATLVGTQTFGKGSVQSLSGVDDGGLLKVTTARWFTPNGQNIDDTGIMPDEIVERTQEEIENELDPQLDKALEILR